MRIRLFIFSTGVKKAKDIEHLYNYLRTRKIAFERCIMLHCVTQYPAPSEAYDLWLLKNA